MSKIAAIAFACAGLGFADLLCIDAWLLPALVASHPPASGPGGMAAAGLMASPTNAKSAIVEPGPLAALGRQPARADAAAPVQQAAATPSPVVMATPTLAPVVVAALPAPAESEPIIVAEAAAPPQPAAPVPRAVYFIQTGAAEPDAAARAELDALAQRLRADRDLEISVYGHADARGSQRANRRLSKQRAQAVARVLQREGVAARRIALAWYGEHKPAVPGAGDDAWAANRRVELRVHRSE
jgi:outer membrane protein OmpA-like peptidoglycan-associated protein